MPPNINDFIDGLNITQTIKKGWQKAKNRGIIQDFNIKYIGCKSTEYLLEHKIELKIQLIQPINHMDITLKLESL